MKILFLATHFADYSVEAAKELSTRADVLLAGDSFGFEREADSRELKNLAAKKRLVTFRQRPFYNRPAAIIKIFLSALRFRPDLIIAHEQPYFRVALMHRLLKLFAPLAVIVHDPAPHAGRDKHLAARNARWTTQVRKQADMLMAHGAYCASLLKRVTPLEGRPLVEIPHGPIMVPDAVTPPPFKKRILMFGRMEAYKGLNILLQATQILSGGQTVFELRLAGGGPELDRLLEQFLATGCCSVHAGFISREQAMAEFAACDIVVAPYTEATQSGVIAAAFANGRAVIASRVGGIPDFLHDAENGLLVEAGNPTALTEAIQRVLDDKNLLLQLTKGASASIAGPMSWKCFADNILGAFETLKNGRTGRGA